MSSLIQLLDRPIAYNPALAKLRAGKVKSGPVAAVFLSQMLYWHNRMGGEWMYKTQADITSETALTRDEQETARKRLVSLGVLAEERRGVPATMHYRINVDRLEALLLEAATVPAKQDGQQKTRMGKRQNVETPQSGLVQPRKLDCGDAANKNVEPPQTSMGEPTEQACGDPANFHTGDYTENTQEITQENKNLSSRNSGESPDVSKSDFLAKHPEAVVYTPSGKSWGTQEDLDCAGWIFQRIQIINPTARQPNWTEWANEVRLMRQLDGRSHRDICELFKVVNRDSFWCQNVLSPRKLREKWDELTVKLLNKPTGNNRASGDTTLRDAAFKRFIGSALPLREPSALEQAARKAASMANVSKMSPEWAQKRWNSIWTEVEQRQGAAGEAA